VLAGVSEDLPVDLLLHFVVLLGGDTWGVLSCVPACQQQGFKTEASVLKLHWLPTRGCWWAQKACRLHP
jgi:hypothetical protein